MGGAAGGEEVAVASDIEPVAFGHAVVERIVEIDPADAVELQLLAEAFFAGPAENPVVASLTKSDVGIRSTGQRVIAVATEESVVAKPTVDHVVARPAEQRIATPATAGQPVQAAPWIDKFESWWGRQRILDSGSAGSEPLLAWDQHCELEMLRDELVQEFAQV